MNRFIAMSFLALMAACGIKSDPVPPPAVNVGVGVGSGGVSAGASMSVSPTANTRITIGI